MIFNATATPTLKHSNNVFSFSNGDGVTEKLPILHYKFNETTGSTFQDAIGSSIGTITGSRAEFTSGKIGNALQINNTSGLGFACTATTTDQLDKLGATTSQYSISFWVKSDVNQVTFSRICEKAATPYPMVLRQSSSTQQIALGLWDATNNPHAYTTNYSNDGNWHHIVYVVDREKTIKVYHNNALELEMADTTVGSINNASSLGFGNTGVGNRWWIGDLDDFRIYSSLLSESEIGNLYNNGVGTENNNVTNVSKSIKLDSGTVEINLKPSIITTKEAN